MFFARKNNSSYDKELRPILDKKIVEYENMYKDYSRMELYYEINNLIKNNLKEWKNICDEENKNIGNDFYEFQIYDINGQVNIENDIDIYALDIDREIEFHSSLSYDKEYQSNYFFEDIIIANKQGIDNIALYRALVNIYRKIRPLTSNEKKLITEDEKKYRKELEKLPKEERADLCWCTNKRIQTLKEKPVNRTLYTILNAIINLDYLLINNYSFEFDQYPNLNVYLLNLCVENLNNYPKSKVILGYDLDLEFIINKIMMSLFEFSKIDYEEINYTTIMQKYDKNKKIIENLIFSLNKFNKEQLSYKLRLFINNSVENNNCNIKFIKFLLKNDIINLSTDYMLVYKTATYNNLDLLKTYFDYDQAKLSQKKLTLVKNEYRFIDWSKGDMIIEKDGSWTQTVKTVELSFLDALNQNTKIKDEVKQFLISKIK